MTKTSASRADNYKAVIHSEDFEPISRYFQTTLHSPIVFHQCVHFVTSSLTFHHQLSTDSFQFHKDENNLEYITLRHETQAKYLHRNFLHGNISTRFQVVMSVQ